LHATANFVSVPAFDFIFMALLNDNYLKLKAGCLFPEIGRRVKAFCGANPRAPVFGARIVPNPQRVAGSTR
jgi:hypothetical protein